MEEDEVHGKEVNQSTQTLSASSAASMTIIQRGATRASVSFVVSPNVLPKIVNLKVKKEETINLTKDVEEKVNIVDDGA